MTREHVDDDYKKKPFTNKAEYFMPPFRSEVSDEELKAAHETIAVYNNDIEQQKKDTRIVCSCGHSQKISDSVFVQTHWYTRPRGCMEGDYWNNGEGQVVCESCGVRMRLYDKCKDLQEHRYCSLFKEIMDCYD